MNTNREPTAAQTGEHDLHAFVDGVLDDSRRVGLFAHLAANSAEAEKVNGYFRQQTMLGELRDALSAEDDDQFLPELQRRIDRAVMRQRLFVAGRRLAAGVAILAPLAAAGWWATQAGQQRAMVQVEPTEIVDSLTFPFGGNFATIQARAIDEGVASLGLLAHHLDSRNLKVPDLGALGLRLVSGETLSGVELPAARLIYIDERGNRLQVYIAVVDGEARQAVMMVPEGHISLNWRSGPLAFAVVGPAGATKLLDVMRSVSNELTEVADAPAVVVPGSGAIVPGAVEAAVESDVRPVAMPEAKPAVETEGPKVLPLEKSPADTDVVPAEHEVQPKV